MQNHVSNLPANWLFNHTGLDAQHAQRITEQALAGMDDGELFLEYAEAESLSFDDGHLKSATHDTIQGYGMRSVLGEASGFAHGSIIDARAIEGAASTVRSIAKHGQSATQGLLLPNRPRPVLYPGDNPLHAQAFAERTALMSDIDAYIRAKDARVCQVSVGLGISWQVVNILRPDAAPVMDVRPMTRLSVTVTLESQGRRESGSSGGGGRGLAQEYLVPEQWQFYADEALRRADVNMHARPAPAGDMPVVLGAGWCGVLLHEAVGHGLEGDFNRKGTSAFAGRVGEQVAAKGVSVVDDGTLPNRRGSVSVDDEGTPPECTMLIEDGVLKGYMQDRHNARLMGATPTGNGRRESYAHPPLPRMTNTYMLAGSHTRDEMVANVENGIYAAYFAGGSVDITSGKFVFSAQEAYKIENGKITHPIKGATLIGSGPEVMQRISMIGNDLELDYGTGRCGKAGQSVPVCVGQPSMLITSMTVGGTE